MGCERSPAYLCIRSQDNVPISAFCQPCGTEVSRNPIEGYRLEVLPDPKDYYPPIPTKTEEKGVDYMHPATPPAPPVPPPAVTTTVTSAGQQDGLAPSYAVYDEDGPSFGPPTADEASTNFFWKYGRESTFELQTTVRGCLNADQLGLHIQMAIDAMLEVMKRGGQPKYSQAPTSQANGNRSPAPSAAPSAPPPAAPPPASAAPGAPPTLAAPASPNGEPRPAPAYNDPLTKQPGAGPFYFMATRMLIKCDRTDGKVSVELYPHGAKYHQVKVVDTPEACAKVFGKCGGWAAEHFNKTNEYSINYKVVYVNSTGTTPKGNPYRNVTDVSQV